MEIDTDVVPAARPGTPAVRSWWYGIGARPTDEDLRLAARRYAVVVLNAWDLTELRRLRALNPKVTVLVYKCLSSTRNYPGAVEGPKGERDASLLPTGVGFHQARKEWFAVDGDGRRIEWNGYPKHWQMAVWNTDYQQAWAKRVVDEVVRDGWDGVLADNDMHTLRWYSDKVVKGTGNRAGTDRLLREGLAGLLGRAGTALRQANKVLVPNISESHTTADRWTTHSRHGGGMEENFALREDNGVLTFAGTEFAELQRTAAAGDRWLLLLTKIGGRDAATVERLGFATAALLAGPRTCWSPPSSGDYRRPGWSSWLELEAGAAREPAARGENGVWTRRFDRAWVAVNPGRSTVRVTPPRGMRRPDGQAVTGTLSLPGRDAVVLVPR
ncbi:putative glycoside hydrolase [Saccharothrix sp. HUAS TT1]|uniref:putative glycoside hydrolase n=1 Tax=unclassified Saccharothrix TaxID=2593673 RepID=UPI00345BE904